MGTAKGWREEGGLSMASFIISGWHNESPLGLNIDEVSFEEGDGI